MSNTSLRQLSTAQLLRLAEAFSMGTILLPCTPIRLRSYVEPGEQEALSAALNALIAEGFGPPQLSRLLRELADERRASESRGPSVELVWTGPESTTSTSRDTFVVVRELFETARHSVLITGYAIWNGRDLFQPLLQRLARGDDLRVRLFLNIKPDPKNPGQELASFARKFRSHHWSGPPWPEVFYDPRGLQGEDYAVLHAKCVVIDDSVALVTSANLTEAAQQSNIEAGTLVRWPPLAQHLRQHFDGLVERGQLVKVPGIEPE